MLADALVDAARIAGIPEQPSPWLPPLADLVVTPAFPGLSGDALPYRAGIEEVPPLAFGVTDLPCGAGPAGAGAGPRPRGAPAPRGRLRSGRSTALRTLAGAIAAGASPDDVHVHAIDCGSGALLPLMAMPHCGAVVTRDQLDRVERLLARLRAEIGRRQQLLAEAGYASLAELRAVQGGPRLPWLVLMLDRWEGFVAAFEGYDYGRLIESLMQLLREGPAVGLRAVVTGDRSALIGQISTVFDDRLILRLADPADYGLAGVPRQGPARHGWPPAARCPSASTAHRNPDRAALRRPLGAGPGRRAPGARPGGEGDRRASPRCGWTRCPCASPWPRHWSGALLPAAVPAVGAARRRRRLAGPARRRPARARPRRGRRGPGQIRPFLGPADRHPSLLSRGTRRSSSPPGAARCARWWTCRACWPCSTRAAT